MFNQIQKLNDQVAIVYLVWSDEPSKFLARALEAIVKQNYARENLRLVVVYNSYKPDEVSQLSFIESEVLKKFGKWHEEFYLYHEDTEYSLRLKINGFRVVLASQAEFFHEYTFSKNLEKFYWLERNRHALKYLFYKWPTLILTWPLEIVYNLGLMIVAGGGGWLSELLRVYRYWLSSKNWQIWRELRRNNLRTRKMSDRQLLAQVVATIGSAELVISAPLKFFVNAIFKLYYYFLRLIVWW